MNGTAATAALSEFVVETRFDELSTSAVHAARIAIVDGFANMCAGSTESVADPVRTVYFAQGGSEECTVAGSGRLLPAPNAAFVNAVQLHCLDFEVQGFPPSHGTSSILPAVLAVAERDRLTGADVIAAFALGWEVQQRLRTAGQHADLRSFHPPGVFGPVAAAAAASRLAGFTPDQAAMAMGYAASNAGGLFGNNGTGAKATHPGRAARVGVESTLLVGAGLTASREILEDRSGFLAAFFDSTFDESELVGGLGGSLHIETPGYLVKPYPAEVFLLFTIQALRELREREELDVSDIADVQIEPALYVSHLVRPNPGTGLEGKFSYEFCAAMALTQEVVAIDSFSDAVLFSDEVQTLLPRIRIADGPRKPPRLEEARSRVVVTMVDGRRWEHTCSEFPGMPTRPMDDATRLAKVADCLAHGGFDEEAAAAAILVWEGLESADDMNRLVRTHARRRSPISEGANDEVVPTT